MIEVFVFITVPLLAWVIIIYNLLVRDKIRVETAWSDIALQLQRRHDLIPKLLDVIKEHADFDSDTLTSIIASPANNNIDIGKINDTETIIDTELKQVLLLSEDYPNLKTNQSFLDLQHHLAEIEKHIEQTRRQYNQAVRNYNMRIAVFPDLLFAKFFRFYAAEYFQNDINKP